jgi:hypothetical protein
MPLSNTLLTGNDGTNLGALPHVRIALPETILSLWILAFNFCVDARTTQLHGCDIKIGLYNIYTLFWTMIPCSLG